MTAADNILSRIMRIAAIVCLIAVLAATGVQAVHMHARSATFDSHCSLCMVSHCVSRPQTSFAFALPIRITVHPQAVIAHSHSRSGIFHWFVRPPPSA